MKLYFSNINIIILIFLRFHYFLISVCIKLIYQLLLILGDDNCKACVAAITFILKNAACHAVSQSYLSNELQQVCHNCIDLYTYI